MSKDTEQLRDELRSLADTLEEVLSSSGEKSKEEAEKLRAKAERALNESRQRLSEASETIARQTREAATKADDYVRENPWTGVGIGAAAGGEGHDDAQRTRGVLRHAHAGEGRSGCGSSGGVDELTTLHQKAPWIR